MGTSIEAPAERHARVAHALARSKAAARNAAQARERSRFWAGVSADFRRRSRAAGLHADGAWYRGQRTIHRMEDVLVRKNAVVHRLEDDVLRTLTLPPQRHSGALLCWFRRRARPYPAPVSVPAQEPAPAPVPVPVPAQVQEPPPPVPAPALHGHGGRPARCPR
ncbi:hypothetical protein ACRAKJ_12180 [Saccharothrix sp. DSM 118769]